MSRSRLFGLLASFAIAMTCAGHAWSAPCVSPVSSCTEWLTVPGTPGRLLLYRTYSLGTKKELVTSALVVIHGASRNADNYYRSAIAAGFLADALAQEVHITALPCRLGQDLGDRLAQAGMVIRDRQLDP